MAELRFDGRVAVVTGAGQGLGKEHAKLLAARGAKVVVNDLGSRPQGGGSSEDPARAVVDEIRARGGEATPDFHSVATPEGGLAIVDTAIGTFGRVDVLIHNAGIAARIPVEEIDPQRLDVTLDVHLRGAFFVIGPAWKHMKAQGYGRILNTASNAGAFGLPGASAYSAAKGGLLGLTRSLANEGAGCGIRVNALAPAARTRLTSDVPASEFAEWWEKWFQPERVSPVAVWLVHEDCPVTGEVYSAGGGRVARVFTAETQGYWSESLSPEEVRDQFDRIRDERGYAKPESSMDEMLSLYWKQIR